MPQDLLKYFEKRLSTAKIKSSKNSGFVTISRQTGCNGSSVAIKLAKRLSKDTEWKHINKEILNESARKLDLKTSKISHLYDADRLTHADEILTALSNKYYKSDKKLKSTISQVVKHYAEEGNIIIVGRAAVGITSKIDGGLHIRLTAPLDWRINSLKKRRGFENVDIKKFIGEHDKKKANMIKRFCNVKLDEIPFDLVINCARFDEDKIVKIIHNAMLMKQIIQK